MGAVAPEKEGEPTGEELWAAAQEKARQAARAREAGLLTDEAEVRAQEPRLKGGEDGG
jgi:hypothetical protein